MRHIDLRAVRDDDLDAIFEMMRDREAAEMVAFGAEDREDRDAFDEWMSRRRASAEVDVLVLEPERPLYGRVAAHNLGAIAVFERNGFTELSRTPMHAPALGREIDELVYVLPPALDGV